MNSTRPSILDIAHGAFYVEPGTPAGGLTLSEYRRARLRRGRWHRLKELAGYGAGGGAVPAAGT
jgi:hypothetical protein